MRRGGGARAAAVVAVALALAALGTAAAGGAQPAWHAAPHAPLRTARFGTISLGCTASGFCLAVESSGQTATWDGAWHAAQHTSHRARQVGPVSCVAESFCVAVAIDATKARTINYVVVWDGSGWQAPVKLYTVKTEAGFYTALHDVSCTSTTFCMANGGGESFEWNGTTWAPHPGIISGTDGNGVIGCASPTLCVNLHDDSPNVWNGSSWRYVHSEPLSNGIPGASGFFTSLSCGSATFCVGVGIHQGVAVWDGMGWSVARGVARSGATSVSCASAAFCVAASTIAHTSLEWNGSTWATMPSFPLGGKASISCGRPGNCLAVSTTGSTAVLSS